MENTIKELLVANSNELFGLQIDATLVQFQKTRKEVEGDLTLVIFPFVKLLRCAPQEAGEKIGQFLVEKMPEIERFEVVSGFLNLSISADFWIAQLNAMTNVKNYGYAEANSKSTVMVEYSSPNTNKPLHLGHLRNNFLGWSMAEIFKKNGFEVVKTSILNDRGIHICKSMIAWQLFGNGATPESTGIKVDHLVGDYYVMFGEEWKKQIQEGIEKGMTKEEAEKEAPIMKAAQQMLVDWEAGKHEVIDIWKMMNSWG